MSHRLPESSIYDDSGTSSSCLRVNHSIGFRFLDGNRNTEKVLSWELNRVNWFHFIRGFVTLFSSIYGLNQVPLLDPSLVVSLIDINVSGSLWDMVVSLYSIGIQLDNVFYLTILVILKSMVRLIGSLNRYTSSSLLLRAILLLVIPTGFLLSPVSNHTCSHTNRTPPSHIRPTR